MDGLEVEAVGYHRGGQVCGCNEVAARVRIWGLIGKGQRQLGFLRFRVLV